MSAGFSKKVTLFLSLLLAVLLAAIGVLWFLTQMKSRDPLADVVIPPDTPRSDAAQRWQETVAPKFSGDPKQSRYLDTDISWEVKDLSPVQKEITFQYQEAPSEYEPVTEVVHLGAPDYVWEDGPRRVELLWIGVGEFDPQARPEPDEYQYTTRFFTPDGAEVPREALPDSVTRYLRYREIVYQKLAGLKYTVVLKFEGFERDKTGGTLLFDARARAPIVPGYLVGSRGDLLILEGITHIVHPGALMTAVDLVSGEPEIFEFDPRETSLLNTPHFRLIYHGGHAGVISGNITRQTGTAAGVWRNSGTFDFQQSPQHAFLGFSLTPEAKGFQVDLEFIGKPGSKLSRMVTSPALDRVISLPAPLEELEKVRVKHYPNVTRVVVHVPELPVAEQNRGVTNLLDVTIPAVRIESPLDLRETLGKVALLRVEQQTGARYAAIRTSLPPFPLDLYDVTPRELISLYLDYPSDQEVTYNPLSNTLTFSPIDRSTPWQRTVRWVNEHLP